MMEDKDIEAILRIIIERLPENTRWGLSGSVNLRVLGCDISPRDFDIRTDKEGVPVFRRAFKDCIEGDGPAKWKSCHTISCKINDFEVDINYFEDNNYGMIGKHHKINWHGIDVPVLPLEDALEFYRLIKREDKIKLIEGWMKK